MAGLRNRSNVAVEVLRVRVFRELVNSHVGVFCELAIPHVRELYSVFVRDSVGSSRRREYRWWVDPPYMPVILLGLALVVSR